MESVDEKYMYRALDLAQKGLGNVAPNPMVGAVIVKDGKVIGEGYHQYYGKKHAEVNAIENAADTDLTNATMYVTLEPCNHFGNTPPCSHALVKAGIKKVVIASVDDNPKVSGSGIQHLEDHGISVETGLLDKENRYLNRRFFTFHRQRRPYVILKWAQTSDGFIARENFDSKWISDEYSRQMTHLWRSQEAAIMVGSNTVIQDDPELTVRHVEGRNPIRIIVDRGLNVPKESKIFNDAAETIVYHAHTGINDARYVQLDGVHFIQDMLRDLYKRNIQSVLVEGGAGLHQAFIQQNLWDEARIFTAPATFGKGIQAAQLTNSELVKQTSLINDQVTIYHKNYEA